MEMDKSCATGGNTKVGGLVDKWVYKGSSLCEKRIKCFLFKVISSFDKSG